jgi:hypothetical protein
MKPSKLPTSNCAGSSWGPRSVLGIGIVLISSLIWHYSTMLGQTAKATLLRLGLGLSTATLAKTSAVDWYAPTKTDINNLTAALSSTGGVYGFIFDSSETTDGDYGTYNWCNMPHVRREEYIQPAGEFALRFVEVVR